MALWKMQRKIFFLSRFSNARFGRVLNSAFLYFSSPSNFSRTFLPPLQRVSNNIKQQTKQKEESRKNSNKKKNCLTLKHSGARKMFFFWFFSFIDNYSLSKNKLLQNFSIEFRLESDAPSLNLNSFLCRDVRFIF